MRFPVKTTIALVVLGVGAALGYSPAREYWEKRTRPKFREVEVTRGPIVSVVDATGTVQPVLSVSVGSFVSGPIEGLYVDFNDVVKKGQLLAKIDERLHAANVARDKATLATQKANVERAQAQLQQAMNDEARALALRKENKNFISDTELDQFKFNRIALQAQVLVAEASVEQAQANLKNSEANLEYTEIRSPVDGVVINRKIDQGQTLAAQFQTPELFIVAPDMKTKMHILASVDEADIGLIREAQRRKLPVRFTVDAYPDDLFTGEVFQIRVSSTTTQNVVTYPVVVAAPNPDLKLLPGMTASLSFQIDESKDVLRIPNAALRFYPQKEHVRLEDRAILEGADGEQRRDPKEAADSASTRRSAVEKAEARRNRHHRHVWVSEGKFLRAIEVTTGMGDHKHTVLVQGDLNEGQKLVTGIKRGE
jgi:HlyD family secretion protein